VSLGLGEERPASRASQQFGQTSMVGDTTRSDSARLSDLRIKPREEHRPGFVRERAFRPCGLRCDQSAAELDWKKLWKAVNDEVSD
jgi:hypothetical protein